MIGNEGIKNTKIKISQYLIFIFCFIFFVPCHADNLVTIFQSALQHDPTYLAACEVRKAASESYPQAVANMLPNIVGTSNVMANQAFNTASTDEGVILAPPGRVSWGTYNYTVSATQTVFNFANIIQLFQADNQGKQAEMTFQTAGQDLILRVSKAYFDALLAQDTLRFVQAQKKAVQEQLTLAQVRFDVGLEAITAVEEARAAYDSIIAQEISAKNNVVNTLNALYGLTGYYVDFIDPLAGNFSLAKPDPLNVEVWIKKAARFNLSLLASQYAAEIAQDQIKVNFSGHLPVVSAIGQYNKTINTSYGTVNNTQRLVGVQMTMPIFSGGMVASQVRQAKDLYLKASDDLEKTYRETIINTRRFYNSVVADVSKVEADKAALLSHQSSLEATNAVYRAGTRTMVDVLIAQQKLFQAQTTLAQDSYAYIMDTYALKQAVGTLNGADLCAINYWLRPSVSHKV